MNLMGQKDLMEQTDSAPQDVIRKKARMGQKEQSLVWHKTGGNIH